MLQQAPRQRQRLAAAAGGGPDVLASRDQEEPVAARRSKDEEDQMLRSLDRVEVRPWAWAAHKGGLMAGDHVARCGKASAGRQLLAFAEVLMLQSCA